MQDKKEENKEIVKSEKEDVIIPFHYETEIVKAVAELKGHRFIQRGPWLHCESCKTGHGVYIGPKLIMVGYDSEGHPKLVRRI